MRLFQPTSAFIRMLSDIISDSKAFLIMMFICIGMFSNAFILLNQNRMKNGLEAVTGTAFGWGPFDTIVQVYLLGLGEFGVEGDGSGTTIAWFLYISATVVLQLVFMNMLIAIMGDTFDRVSEIKT